jgi:hypothetical protein
MTHTLNGKWSEADVPHKGWSCVEVDDLGEPSQTCEMCGTVEIRYVHYMTHPDYPVALAVGCVCAEHMEEDYTRPREREKRLRTLARRRKTWGQRKWSVLGQDNLSLNAEGYLLTLTRASHSWKVIVENRETRQKQVGHKHFKTETEAKDAALIALIWAKDHLSSKY